MYGTMYESPAYLTDDDLQESHHGGEEILKVEGARKSIQGRRGGGRTAKQLHPNLKREKRQKEEKREKKSSTGKVPERRSSAGEEEQRNDSIGI